MKVNTRRVIRGDRLVVYVDRELLASDQEVEGVDLGLSNVLKISLI